jgi:hypothetical protein
MKSEDWANLSFLKERSFVYLNPNDPCKGTYDAMRMFLACLGARFSTVDWKDDFAKLQQDTKIKDDRIAKLENSLTELQDNFRLVAEILQKNPSIADVEGALRRKRGSGVVTS